MADFIQKYNIYSDVEILGQLQIRHTNMVNLHDLAPIFENLFTIFAGMSDADVMASIAAAIAALTEGSTEALNTLKEITDAMAAADNAVAVGIIQDIADAKAELRGTVSTELDTMQEIIERIGFVDEAGIFRLNATTGTATLSNELTDAQRQSVGHAVLAVSMMIQAEQIRAQAAETVQAAYVAQTITDNARLVAEAAMTALVTQNADAIVSLTTQVVNNLTGSINDIIDSATDDFNTLGKIETAILADRDRLSTLESTAVALQANIDALVLQCAQILSDRRNGIVNASFSTEVELYPGGVQRIMPISIDVDRGWDIERVITECTLLLVDGTEVNTVIPFTKEYMMRGETQVITLRGYVTENEAPLGSKLRIVANNIELIK